MMKFYKTTLPNGVRVITIPAHDNPSATVMVAAETGSYYETKSENGLSHFLEHMLFKGTPTRPSALSVSTELDTIGAESNAFTTNELTAYYAKSQTKHWQKLLEVVSDIYLNPSFPAADLEKERGVILQEISMYEDLPKSMVWDAVAKLLYGDTPAGRTISGPKKNIQKFVRPDFLSYHRKHYVPSKTIIVVAGDVTPKAVEEEVKKIFTAVSKAPKREKEKVKEKQSSPQLLIVKKKSEQTHLVMALRAFPAVDKRAPILWVLRGILGAGSSSRLFQRLREEMGACYYVYATSDLTTDHGYMAIATGIDKSRITEVVQALIDECKRLTYEVVSDKELQKVKDYILGHMYMGLETTDALAGFYLSEEIIHSTPRTPQEVEEQVRKVTAKEVQELAQELFRDDKLNLAIVGNVSDSKGIKKVLTFTRA